MVGILTAKQMLKEGLDVIGISQKRRRRLSKRRLYSKFKAHFGRHPLHVARVWRDLLTTTIPEARVDDDAANIIGFLASLNFVTVYAEEEIRDDFLGDLMHLNKMRALSWFFVGKIAALKALKIVWPADHEWTTTFVASVDGTHTQINKPRDPLVWKNRNLPRHCSWGQCGMQCTTTSHSCNVKEHLHLPMFLIMFSGKAASLDLKKQGIECKAA